MKYDKLIKKYIQEFHVEAMGYKTEKYRKALEGVLGFCIIYCIFSLPLVWYISLCAMRGKKFCIQHPKAMYNGDSITTETT